MSTKFAGLLVGVLLIPASQALAATPDEYRAAGGFEFKLFGNGSSDSNASGSSSPGNSASRGGNASRPARPAPAVTQGTPTPAAKPAAKSPAGKQSAPKSDSQDDSVVGDDSGATSTDTPEKTAADKPGSSTAGQPAGRAPRPLSERLKAIRNSESSDDTAVVNSPKPAANLPSSRRSAGSSPSAPIVGAAHKKPAAETAPAESDTATDAADSPNKSAIVGSRALTPNGAASLPGSTAESTKPLAGAQVISPKADTAAPEAPPRRDLFSNSHESHKPSDAAASKEPAKPLDSAPAASRSLLSDSTPTAAAKADKQESSETIRREPKNEPVAEAAPGISSAGGLLFTRQSPLISVETVGPRTITLGKEAQYLVIVKNAGEAAAQDVTVSVKIPDWTDVVSSQATTGTARAGAAETAEPLSWKLPKVDSHGKETLTLRLIPRKGRSFDLGVQWTISPIASQTVVEVQEPKLNMSIAGPDEVMFGQSKVYRLTLANPGTGDAENVVVHLSPVANSAAPPTNHPIGTLHAGESKVIELELTARQSGTLSVKAAATADGGLQSEAAQEVLVRRAAVATVIDSAKTRYAGTMTTYSVKVSNPGNATADNIKISATLPQGAKFVSASAGGQLRAEQGKVVWTVPSLKAGAETTFELKCTLTAPGPNRLQIATTASADVGDIAAFTTNVEALADLKLEVVDPSGPIAVGDEVVYELHVRNRGTKSAESVAVIAYFSEGIEPVSAQGAAHDIANGVVAFHPLDAVPAGADTVFKIRARADKSGKQIFRAEIECGAIGAKLVSATEMMIYGADSAAEATGDRAIARRPAPPDAAPGTDAAAPLRR